MDKRDGRGDEAGLSGVEGAAAQAVATGVIRPRVGPVAALSSGVYIQIENGRFGT